jgi:hypothetical protein
MPLNLLTDSITKEVKMETKQLGNQALVHKGAVDKQVGEVVNTVKDVQLWLLRSAQVWQKQDVEDTQNLNKELRKVQSSNKNHTELFNSDVDAIMEKFFTYRTVGCNPSQLPLIDVNERDQSPVSAEACSTNPGSKIVTVGRDLRSNCSSCVPDIMNGTVRVNVDPVSY